ncbi:MAG: SDR family oxidoreductase [Zetaproteobacteria bacterium]|nr:SDR family oxidoreductase [Zetaproteobacteria bacterium]
MTVRLSRKPRVLVTGGAGFIGSHLCERYLEMGYEVLCLDNFFTGSKENIAHLRHNPDFELIRHDVIEPFRTQVELILNFACPASPVHYQWNPIYTMKTSVLGTLNMLGLAKRTQATLVQASTSEIYGDPQQHPQTEEYWGNVNPIGIRSCYDEGKRSAETLCADYVRTHGVDARIVRIFNTYGPQMACNDGRVVSNFITQAIQNQDITLYGNGQQTRSFCYVDDLIDGIVAVASAAKPSQMRPYNLGNDKEITMKELADQVLPKVGSTSKIVFQPLPQDDPKCRRPDLTRTTQDLHWRPKVSLAEGLDRTIPYFRERLNQPA